LELSPSSTAVHLGTTHGPASNINQIRVQERIKATTKSVYALFGAGFHGKNGLTPVLIRKLWLTYILPRLLYGTELWMLQGSDLEKMEVFQRVKLRQLQNLPEQCSNLAVMGLAGLLPIEGEISRKALNLFRNIAAKDQQLEHQIAMRQLAVKDYTSNSWFIYIDGLLDKYELPNAHVVLANPPTKQHWKELVKHSITTHWENKFYEESLKKGLSSIRFMSKDTRNLSKPALVWTSITGSPREGLKVRTKAKLLCGCLILQALQSKFKQSTNKSPICQLCHSSAKNREHFLLHCALLDGIR
jgi:hypothetical protein